MLTGLVLPLLPNQPVTDLTDITPRQVWLAVLAVCTVSYASYLLQRYMAPAGAGLWVAVLGGLYSSTATTVVLARRAGAEPATLLQAQTGIILATAVMYLRLLVIILVFNRPLALGLAPALLGLSVLGFVIAGFWYWISGARPADTQAATPPANRIGTRRGRDLRDLVRGDLAGLASARSQYGATGVYVLAAIVGVSDIDPFVLSLAERGAGQMPVAVGIVAILIAASSNNLLKAGYASPSPAFAPVLLRWSRLDCWRSAALASQPGWRTTGRLDADADRHSLRSACLSSLPLRVHGTVQLRDGIQPARRRSRSIEIAGPPIRGRIRKRREHFCTSCIYWSGCSNHTTCVAENPAVRWRFGGLKWAQRNPMQPVLTWRRAFRSIISPTAICSSDMSARKPCSWSVAAMSFSRSVPPVHIRSSTWQAATAT